MYRGEPKEGWNVRRLLVLGVLAASLAVPSGVAAQVTVDGCIAHFTGAGPAAIYRDGLDGWDQWEEDDFEMDLAHGTYRVVWSDGKVDKFAVLNCAPVPDETDEPYVPPVDDSDPPDDPPAVTAPAHKTAAPAATVEPSAAVEWTCRRLAVCAS